MNTNGSSLNGGNGKRPAVEEAHLDVVAENKPQRPFDDMIAVDQEPLEADTAGSPGINDLWGIGMDALKIRPPLLLSSILGRPWTWIEHFGTEQDIVARLGMQAPNPDRWGIKIDGPRYVHAQAWGHFLNAHYLFDIEDAQKVRRKRGGRGTVLPYELVNPEAVEAGNTPRLFHYLNGGVC